MKDWTETTITDISEVNDLLKWLYGDIPTNDVKKKVEELEKRIEKLEHRHEERTYRTDRFGKPYNAYDLSQRPDLRKRKQKKWRK
jgi:hypothetical protein